MAPFCAAEQRFARSIVAIAVLMHLFSAAEGEVLVVISTQCRCPAMSLHPENQEREDESCREMRRHRFEWSRVERRALHQAAGPDRLGSGASWLGQDRWPRRTSFLYDRVCFFRAAFSPLAALSLFGSCVGVFALLRFLRQRPASWLFAVGGIIKYMLPQRGNARLLSRTDGPGAVWPHVGGPMRRRGRVRPP